MMGVTDIPTKPSHFQLINLEKKVRSKFVDITDLKKLKIFISFKPDYVFHLAAQSLVKKSTKIHYYLLHKCHWNIKCNGVLKV